MGTFSRLNQLLQANLRAVLDQAEDPDKLIAQTLSELNDGLKQARRDLITAEGTAKRLSSEVQDRQAEAEKWEERAVLALRAGDEELAREALRQKLQAAREVGLSRGHAQTARQAADRLQAAIAQLQQRADDLDARKAALAAQVRAARAPAASGGGAQAGVGKLQALTDRIDALEAEVEVGDVLGDPERARLEARFAELEASAGGQVVEDELAALKRRVEGAE